MMCVVFRFGLILLIAIVSTVKSKPQGFNFFNQRSNCASVASCRGYGIYSDTPICIYFPSTGRTEQYTNRCYSEIAQCRNPSLGQGQEVTLAQCQQNGGSGFNQWYPNFYPTTTANPFSWGNVPWGGPWGNNNNNNQLNCGNLQQCTGYNIYIYNPVCVSYPSTGLREQFANRCSLDMTLCQRRNALPYNQVQC